MLITEKNKADMLDRLATIYNNTLQPSFTLSPNTFCLAVIAICMLENQPTVEDIARYHKKGFIRWNSHQSQSGEEDEQGQPSSQQP